MYIYCKINVEIHNVRQMQTFTACQNVKQMQSITQLTASDVIKTILTTLTHLNVYAYTWQNPVCQVKFMLHWQACHTDMQARAPLAGSTIMQWQSIMMLPASPYCTQIVR